MLKIRIIPTLLWKNFGLVKGLGFDSRRRIGTILPAVNVYNLRQVDELILLDITATAEGRDPDYSTVEEISRECFVPLTVGGGIRKLDHIRELLQRGADKVCINSAAYDNLELIRQAAERFGSQCIVVSIDYRATPEGLRCYRCCGREDTGHDPVEWARQLEAAGAGEILLTSIERDGTMQGYDIPTLAKVAEAVSIPVIASGGCGSYLHMAQALEEGHASAVAAASIFHFTQQTPQEAKHFLKSRGLPVRITALQARI
jgi:cyclase